MWMKCRLALFSAFVLAVVASHVPASAFGMPAQDPPPAKPAPQQPQQAEPAKPTTPEGAPAVPAAVDPKTYVIGPEDVINITIWREKELSGPRRVRPDGKITLPLVQGDMDAAGSTPEQLTKKIAEAYSKILQRPEVSVEVYSVESKKIFISGEVNRPGPLLMPTPITVLQALSLAGGFREWANRSKVLILRGNERLKFNYKDVIKGKNMNQNIMLQAGDHIIVQ